MRKITATLLSAAMVLSFASAALAETDTSQGTTQVEVQASISLSGVPASIDFGSGIPGDTASATAFVATVTTNNIAGYSLDVTTSGLDPADPVANTETIAASAVKYNVDAGADKNVVDATTAVQLATSSERSLEAGDDFSIVASLEVPFVNSDTYSGTADFVASTL